MITTNTDLITKTLADNGTAFYTTVRRGVEYCAYLSDAAEEWFVSSRRLSLGRWNTGGGKYYANIEDCKAFAALPALLKMGAI
jgi:hypothetical protein